MNHFLDRRKGDILFISLLLSVSLLYNYHKILVQRPYSTHQWRQADCLSITLNYYEESRGFFEPAVHWAGEKEGKTVSECPLIYFLVAQLWRLFGYHEYFLRLVNVIIVFLGLFSLFRLIQNIISDTFWAITITLFLFTSPVLVYYSNNFLADAPAFGLVLCGSLFMWKGLDQQKLTLFLLSFLFFLTAGLIKISSIILLSAIFAIHVCLVLFPGKSKTRFYRWPFLIPYLAVFSVLSGWYLFAIHYNHDNISGIFLTGIYPIWDVDPVTRKSIWGNLINDLVPSYLNKTAVYFIFFLYMLLFIFYRKINKLLLFLNVLVLIGIISFILLFYQAFTVHDYYLINLLIFVPLPILTMAEMVKRNYPSLLKYYPVKIIAALFVLFLIYNTAVITRIKYSTNDWFVRNSLVTSKRELDYWKWYHSDYENHYKAYETIGPYLRNLGIKRTDKVLSLPDPSVDITLYFMDQKGYTAFGYNDLPFDQKMLIYKKNGVKYMIIDSALNEESYLKPYLKDRIGQYKNIGMFRIYQPGFH